MTAWTPILVQKIEIQALGFVLRKLQLNRHNPTEVPLHRHEHAQLILYLAGEALQRVGQRKRVARSGDLFVIPPGALHGCAVQRRKLPVCLVLDYEMEHRSRSRATHRRVPPDRLNELSSLLGAVPSKGRLTLFDYSSILAIVARLLDQAPKASKTRPPSLFEQVRSMLHAPAALADIAKAAGYHPDHLTRKLKRETGLGLRDLRDRVRLTASQNALRAAPNIAEAANLCGFEDPNYFARWFRRQTGRSPSAWKR